MGASFRNAGQIRALAGCDLLTISPALLAELAASDAPLERALNAADAATMEIERLTYTEDDGNAFRWALNEDAMASEKLGEGIRIFAADARRLDALLQAA